MSLVVANPVFSLTIGLVYRFFFNLDSSGPGMLKMCIHVVYMDDQPGVRASSGIKPLCDTGPV